jgi:hypothetical protein
MGRDRYERQGFLGAACGAAAIWLGFGLAAAGETRADDIEGPCALTARAALVACSHEAEDDYFIAIGKCANERDADERARCRRAADVRRQAAPVACHAQFEGRDDFCDDVGQAPYDPVIDPEDFVAPADIGGAVAPNPYFPLVPGSTWTYANEDETNVVTVTGETIEVAGVTCAVVHDVVVEDGEPVEVTDDYFAQDRDGNVWYFGEISLNFEDGRIADIEGSWRAGEERAKPGIVMPAAPREGAVYRQEFALGDAEDGAEILSTTASATVPAASCEGDCVLTEDFNLLEPGAKELKYYAPGVGFILETDPDGAGRLELIEFRIGAR